MKKEGKDFSDSLFGFIGNLISLGILLLIIYCVSNYFKNDKLGPDEIKIGEKIYSRRNLSISQFRNGDAIPIVSSNEEWLRYIIEERPSCRMVNDELSKDFKETGLLYNFYAIRDFRELAPKGWSIMTLQDWQDIHKEMNGNLDNYYFFRVYNPTEVVLSNGDFLPIEEGGAWWLGANINKIVGIIKTENGIQMDTNDYYGGGFAVRCVKNEKTFLEKIGL